MAAAGAPPVFLGNLLPLSVPPNSGHRILTPHYYSCFGRRLWVALRGYLGIIHLHVRVVKGERLLHASPFPLTRPAQGLGLAGAVVIVRGGGWGGEGARTRSPH